MDIDTPNQLQSLTVLNLRDHIKRQICEAILKGIFAPGERLVEATIAEQLGVSRAPVREALSALEREGVVVSVPRRGYFVRDLSEQDIEEIYSLRLILELGALPRCIERATNEDISALQRIVDQMGVGMGQAYDAVTLTTLDLSFHERICKIAGHQRLYAAWDNMRLQTWLLIGLTSRSQFEYPEQSKDFHQGILDAIRNGDLAQAEAALTQHLRDAETRARTVWNEIQVTDIAQSA